ncbi:RNI-like protein, partial [Aureobasidium melanogenum]
MRRHQPPSALPPNDPLSLLRAYDHESNPSRPIRSSPLTASTIHGLPLELTDRLRSFPLFASAPDSFLVAIGKFLRPQLFQPHEYILTEGDDAKAMYWLVRGSLRVTSRDGESTYAELKPGAFFGEIGILMDIPRTATIIAQLRSLVLKLNKEDLQKVLPAFPAVERAIRDEATERLSILERLKKERVTLPATSGLRKRSRDFIERDVDMQDVGFQDDSNKRRKSPSPSLAEAAANSVLGSANLTVRQILQELPLFAGLPAEILHFLGVNAQPCSFGPFIDIITQGSQGRDVFFLVRGEVEVVTETPGNKTHEVTGKPLPVQRVRARLKPGQYFGEVTSLSLAPKRTATVRSINSVECLRITGQVLDELWKNWSSSLRQQVEQEAKRRLKEVEDTDIVLPDAPSAIDALSALPPEDQWKKSVPTVTFSNTELESAIVRDMSPVAAEPLDPDPFFSIDIDNILHGYCWGNALWYGSRGLCRVWDPLMVIGWFRPPVESHLKPTDLELYNVRTDGWGLISLAASLMVLSRAYARGGINRTYSKAFIAVSIFHHVTTMIGAYQHYKLDTHYTKAMWIGVWVNAFLTAVGGVVMGGLSNDSVARAKIA